MSLLARRHWRSAGRGQCAPGLRAPRLRILCARSRDAGGARAGAGGRYWSGAPEGSAPAGWLGRAPGTAASAGRPWLPQLRAAWGRESEPRFCPAAGHYCRLSPFPSRRREVSRVLFSLKLPSKLIILLIASSPSPFHSPASRLGSVLLPLSSPPPWSQPEGNPAAARGGRREKGMRAQKRVSEPEGSGR